VIFDALNIKFLTNFYVFIGVLFILRGCKSNIDFIICNIIFKINCFYSDYQWINFYSYDLFPCGFLF